MVPSSDTIGTKWREYSAANLQMKEYAPSRRGLGSLLYSGHFREATRGSGKPYPHTEDDVNFEEAGKIIDSELKKFVEFVEEKVRPKTRQEMAQLLRKASKNLTKAAQSLERK